MIPTLLGITYMVCIKVCSDMSVTSVKTKLLIIALVYLISLTIWLKICWWVPKTKHGVIGIYLCIKTKGHEEREKLHTEIVNSAQDLIDNMGLSELITIYELNNLQTSRVRKYLKPLKIIAQSNHEKMSKLAGKINKFLNAAMIIDGRMSICNNNGVYYIDTNSTVFHPAIDTTLQKKLSELMSLTWTKDRLINTNDEINGFKTTTSSLMVHLLFIIGFVAYIADNLSISSRLLESLQKTNLVNMVGNENIPKRLQGYITEILRNSFGLLATRYIDMNDQENASLYLRRLCDFGKSYGYFVTKAIYDFMILHNVPEALRSIDQASVLAGSDKSWMYSKGFLLFYSYKYDEALKYYHKSMKGSSNEDSVVVDQVIKFIEHVIENAPERSDFKFVIGLLSYKKLKNYPRAYKNLDEYIESKCNGSSLMNNRAKAYLKELSNALGYSK